MNKRDLIHAESINQINMWAANHRRPVIFQTKSPKIFSEILVSELIDTLTDVVEIRLQSGLKNISISQIADIRQIAKSRPQETSAITFVIIEAELMSIEAQNAMLKILEEPPASVNFVLISGAYNKLLPTITSRTQLINISEADKHNYIQYLSLQGLDEAKAELIYRLNSNAPLDLANYTDRSTDNTGVEIAKEFIGANQVKRLEISSSIKSADEALNFLDKLALVSEAAMKNSLKQGSSKAKTWLKYLGSIQEAQQLILANGNVKANLDNLVINL